ncbi:Sec-independent protein translocase protein TatCy [Chlamydia abortus]|uniref:Sec-independent protein translocase protein TatC n=1 Tax=Paenibacillus residui TaxID=629724 RepID=A0ABW3D662_9BACL|nr:twin-arginine translocase subunit TatC [Paenibacillus sp. 32O-W]SHE13593.1 Sec-independent protein translocase protein TatCy [Chlamydia abortus]
MDIKENLVVHLTELRKRLIVVATVLLGAMCAGLYLSPAILRYVQARPGASGIEWNVFSLTDGLFVYMKCAFLFAILFTLPVLLYQIWAFVRPGLTDAEARGTLAFVPASFLLFLTGTVFGYYVVFPMMVGFMKTMNASIGAMETYGIDRYFSFLFNVVFPMGVSFEMPVVVLFLTRLGLLTPERLKGTRKYAYVGLAIVGALISPPDFISHLSVTIPLIALFEISAALAGHYYRRLATLSTNTQ